VYPVRELVKVLRGNKMHIFDRMSRKRLVNANVCANAFYDIKVKRYGGGGGGEGEGWKID